MSLLIIDQSSVDSSPERTPRSSSFNISWAKYEDVRRLVDIEFFAFENEKTNQVLSYRDHNQPAHFQRAVRSYQSSMSKAEGQRRRKKTNTGRPRPRRHGDLDTTRFRKVTKGDSGLIISWAKAETKQYTADELNTPAYSGHEADPLMNKDWFALNEKLRRDYMGTRRHCYIGMVATQPAYQHMGAGTMLLQDIVAEADAAGIECYLEATDTAKPLYEKHGFVTVNELRFDPAAYGVQGFSIERQTIMVRGALDARGARQSVRSWEAATGAAQV